MDATRPVRRAPLLVASLLLILPSILYIAIRYTVSGDGALLNLMGAVPTGSGLFIQDTSGPSNVLQAGDHLVSINGISIDQWMERTLDLSNAGDSVETLNYVVLRSGEPVELQVSLERIDLADQLGSNWASYLFLIYLLAVSIYIFVRKPDTPGARALLIASSTICASGLTFFTGLQASDLIRVWPFWIFIWGSIVIYALSMAAIGQFSLSFPRPRKVLTDRPYLPLLVFLAFLIPYIALVSIGWARSEFASARFLFALRATGIFTAGYALLGLGVITVGYIREFTDRERRQTRWLMWAAVIVIIPWIGLSTIPPLFGANPVVPQSVIGLFWLLLPTAFAIAIVRENLFDIDQIINRTLVYFILTVVLASVYLLGVVVLQIIFREVSGQERPLAVVISTLAIAGLFNPLRYRVQGLIDRRFYRARYDATLTLSSLSEGMRDRVDQEDLSAVLITTIDEVFQPKYVSLWLREGNRKL